MTTRILLSILLLPVTCAAADQPPALVELPVDTTQAQHLWTLPEPGAVTDIKSMRLTRTAGETHIGIPRLKGDISISHTNPWITLSTGDGKIMTLYMEDAASTAVTINRKDFMYVIQINDADAPGLPGITVNRIPKIEGKPDTTHAVEMRLVAP